MKKLPQISDTEWQVMKILWSSSPLTANQVIEQLEGVTAWKPKTIKTLLARLLKKKAVAFNKEAEPIFIILWLPKLSVSKQKAALF